ncbi:MAG: hypothetical protein WAK37_00055, partial [Pseudolabrys sp.]
PVDVDARDIGVRTHAVPGQLCAGMTLEGLCQNQIPKYCEYFFLISSVGSPQIYGLRAKHNKFRHTARGLKPKGNPGFANRSRGYFPSMICSLNRRP